MENKGGGQDSLADLPYRKAYNNNKKKQTPVWELKLHSGIWELLPITVLHKAYLNAKLIGNNPESIYVRCLSGGNSDG